MIVCSFETCGSPMGLLRLVAVAVLLPVLACAQEWQVNTADELHDALVRLPDMPNITQISLMRPIQISSSNWTTVNVSSAVKIVSPWRAVLDFCDEECRSGRYITNAPWIRVLPGGVVTFQRIFFRNFLPPREFLGNAELAKLNPTPFIENAGGVVTYRLIPWHFRPFMLWVFDAGEDYFWNYLKDYDLAHFGEPVTFSLTTPRTYFTKGVQNFPGNPNIMLKDCYIPVDVDGCYDGLDNSVTLAYCPFTFRDSLLNPHVSKVLLFHNIGWDRTVYRFWSPFVVSRVVDYVPCPGKSITIDMDNITDAVVVRDGRLTFNNLTLTGSEIQQNTVWPANNPLFLSGFKPTLKGYVKLNNVTVEAGNVESVTTFMLSLSNCSAGTPGCTADPQNPSIAPLGFQRTASGFYMRSWTMDITRWASTINANQATLDFSDVSGWLFSDVSVVPVPSDEVCYHSALSQGIIAVNGQVQTVSSSSELRAALANQVRFVQVVNNITLNAAEWPSGDSAVVVSRSVELRACTVNHTKLIIDFQNLQDVIRVVQNGSMLVFTGDIRLVNLGWTSMTSNNFKLIGAVTVRDDALLQFENVVLNGVMAADMAKLNGTSVVLDGLGLLQYAKVQNATTDADGLHVYAVHANNTAQGLGSTDVITSTVTWTEQPAPTPVPVWAIVVPIIVGLALLTAGVFAVLFWRRRRRLVQEESVHTSKDVQGTGSSSRKTLSSVMGPFLALGSSHGHSSNSKTRSGPSQDIEDACRSLVSGKTTQSDENIVLDSVLGEGSYGKVYKGCWKGTVVAVKIMVLPSYMSGKEKREKMAVMETAISSSLSHPNIVQTYTYSVEPVKGNATWKADVVAGRSISLHDSTVSLQTNSSEVYSWEVRLVQEFCDRGSLRDALNASVFRKQDGSIDIGTLIDTALDVARAMAHLHTQNIVHSDLKARNVLLKSTVTEHRGFMAKVADFGLSLKMDPSETHVSNAYQGTMTHMAPETLVHGHISRASDVYAFGILLWELYTGEHAYKGLPKALLGHSITKQALRPQFSEDCPFDYQFLAYRCWETDPTIRPSFEQVYEELKRIRCKLTGEPLGTAAVDQQALTWPHNDASEQERSEYLTDTITQVNLTVHDSQDASESPDVARRVGGLLNHDQQQAVTKDESPDASVCLTVDNRSIDQSDSYQTAQEGGKDGAKQA